eukprot:1743251-Ditylum_brightwellii.AAC.1
MVASPEARAVLTYKGRVKAVGALCPEGLLSMLNPLDKSIVPGPSSTEWLRRLFTIPELADAYNLLTFGAQKM